MFSASAPPTDLRWLHRYDRFVPCRDIAGLNCLGLIAAAASISILVVRKTPRNVMNCNY
jgi:hypothetical protein